MFTRVIKQGYFWKLSNSRDLVLITENGYEVLNHYPHDIEIID